MTMRWTEAVYTNETNQKRGDFAIKQNFDRLYALIGSRWCSVWRSDDTGRLYELFDDAELPQVARKGWA